MGQKKALTDIYQDIYSPVEGEISTLLGDLEDNISFQAEIRLMDTAFDEKALHYINLKYAGMFKRSYSSKRKNVKIGTLY